MISPKEKAKKLVRKYWDLSLSVEKAKECALICVDEMIKAFTQLSKEESGTTLIDYGQDYLQEVKTEIEKL